MKKQGKDKLGRRSFLKGAALTGAAVGSGAATTGAMADDSQPGVEPPAREGYRETDHVRDYYRLARF